MLTHIIQWLTYTRNKNPSIHQVDGVTTNCASFLQGQYCHRNVLAIFKPKTIPYAMYAQMNSLPCSTLTYQGTCGSHTACGSVQPADLIDPIQLVDRMKTVQWSNSANATQQRLNKRNG